MRPSRSSRPSAITFVFEIGRMISGNAGILITRVIYVKQGEGKVFVSNVNPGISTTDARAQGFEDEAKKLGLDIGQAHQIRRPGAEQTIAPRDDPELQFLIARISVFECLFAVVEGGHGGPLRGDGSTVR